MTNGWIRPLENVFSRADKAMEEHGFGKVEIYEVKNIKSCTVHGWDNIIYNPHHMPTNEYNYIGYYTASKEWHPYHGGERHNWEQIAQDMVSKS